MANLVERETENKPALIIVNGHRVRDHKLKNK